MNKSRFDHLRNILSPILLSVLFVLFVSVCTGCSKPKRGEWVMSNNGIKVFVPTNFADNYDPASLRCENTYEELGDVVLYGKEFEISVKDKTGGRHIFKRDFIPTIFEDSDLKVNEKGSEDAYWIIAGNHNNAETNGYAFEMRVAGNEITQFQYGDFKDDKLTHGFRSKFYDDRGRLVYSCGKFKDNMLYQGYKRIVTSDSIGELTLGVWDSDGSMNQTYLDLCRLNYGIYNKLNYTTEQKAEADVKFTHRYFFWLNYKWFVFVGLGLIGFLVFVAGIVMFMYFSDIEYSYETEPWNKKKAYLLWLLGPIGIVYIYLRKAKTFYLTLALWVAIVGSSKFFVLYGLEPRMWPYLIKDAINSFEYWQFWVIAFFTLIWVITFFTIPYSVYKVNLLQYRHNIYEDLINNDEELEYVKLSEEIPNTVKSDAREIESILRSSQETYDEELGGWSKAMSWATNAKVKHARQKAEFLQENCEKIVEIVDNERYLTKRLVNLLCVERTNAYRNLALAKELIFLIRNANQQKQTMQSDGAIDLPQIDLPELKGFDVQSIDFESVLDNANDIFLTSKETLVNLGLDPKKSEMASLGLSVATFTVDAIISENARRTQEREFYEEQSAAIIQQIEQTHSQLPETHAKMLRAKEILESLAKVNVVFVKAYSPLRDYVFGSKASLRGYLKHISGKDKKNAENISEQITYLVPICRMYNEINQAKL